MKIPKTAKPSNNHPDKMINELLLELEKYTHYSQDELDTYYFIKRLQLKLGIYKKFIIETTSRVAKAESGLTNQKKLNKVHKEKK